MKKNVALFFFALLGFSLFAQGETAAASQSLFLSDLKIYVVVAVLLIILLLIAMYLFSVEKRLKKIENS